VSLYLQYKWVILFLAWTIYFAFGTFNGSLAPLADIMIRDLDLSYSQMGAIMGSWPLLYIVFGFFVGLLIDRFGVRISLALGLFGITVSELLRAFATNFEGMFLSVAIFGSGGCIISIGLPKLITYWFRSEERKKVTSIYPTGSRIGRIFALTSIPIFLLYITSSWRNVLQAFSILGVVILGLWILFGKNSPIEKPEKSLYKKSTMQTISTLLRNKGLWTINILAILRFFIGHSMSGWLFTIILSKDIPPSIAGILTAISVFSGITGSLLAPKISQIIKSTKRTILINLLLSSIGLYLMATTSGVLLIISIILFSFTTGEIQPLIVFSLMELPGVGTELMGAASGLYFTFGEIGGVLGPFITGLLKDLSDSFFTGFLLLIMITYMMIPLIFKLPEKKIDSSFKIE
jgi:cyanate permease